MKTPTYVILYLIFMSFTYLWRLISIGIVEGMAKSGISYEEALDITASMIHICMFINYVILAYICRSRGKVLNKKWLAALPLVGCFFDMVLIFIPLVPTIMNILALVMGLSDGKQEVKVVYVEKPSSEAKS